VLILFAHAPIGLDYRPMDEPRRRFETAHPSP